MIVYHGSYCVVENPDISHSRDNLDFGKGFYLTDIKKQAEAWTERYARNGKEPILNLYEFDFDLVKMHYNIKTFSEHNEEWLDFIIACRKGKANDKYDIIIGGVANDRVYDTIELYFDHLIDKKEAIKRLQYHKPNNQICIREQSILDKYLSFVSSEVVGNDGK